VTVRTDEISVVVQGPVVGKVDDAPDVRLTAACLQSIRHHLPGAEIILSTWIGSDLRNLDFDRVVESVDAGSVSFSGVYNLGYNLNRQIRSSSAGLRHASRPYAMKLRSDMRIGGTGFLQLFDQFPARNNEWRVFDRRLVACNLVSQNVRRRGLPMCPSDWVHFGQTIDVRKLWDIPEDEGNNVARYFEHRERPKPDKNPILICRYAPEQYVWLHCLKKDGPVDFDHIWDSRPEVVKLTELTIANNLILADEDRLGIRFCKYRQQLQFRLLSYTHTEWLGLYRQYCDPGFRGVSSLRLAWERGGRNLAMITQRVASRMMNARLSRNENTAKS